MKQPNWKPALILSSTVFALGTFTYWLQYSHKPKQEKADTLQKKPLSFNAETVQISSFRVKSPNGVIEAKCESLAKKSCKVGTTGEWSITYPEKVAGDADTIKDFLNNASGMLAAETIDLNEEPEDKRTKLIDEYGLSDSKRTRPEADFVELTLEDGKKLTAWFGEPHPIGDKTFVASASDGKLNSSTIFLIANFYKTNLFTKTLTYFRDKTIFKFNRSEVEQFEGTTTKGKLSGRLTNGLWTINGLEADYDRVETLLSSIAQEKAKEFPAPTELKGAKTSIRYTLHLKGGKEVSFEILKDAKRTFLKGGDLSSPVEIESNLVVQIDKKINELRRNLLITQAEKVTATDLTLEGKEYSPPAQFHYDGKNWVQKSTGTRFDPLKVQNLIDQLASTHSPEIVSPAPAVPGDAVTLTLGDSKNPAKSRLKVYQVKDQAYAKDLLSKANEAFVLDGGLKNLFPFKADLWKAK
jgi:hypothetical protein